MGLDPGSYESWPLTKAKPIFRGDVNKVLRQLLGGLPKSPAAKWICPAVELAPHAIGLAKRRRRLARTVSSRSSSEALVEGGRLEGKFRAGGVKIFSPENCTRFPSSALLPFLGGGFLY